MTYKVLIPFFIASNYSLREFCVTRLRKPFPPSQSSWLFLPMNNDPYYDSIYVPASVADEVNAWQSPPLKPVYPIIYLDCMHVKVRDTDAVRVKAVYLAIGINMAGEKEVLGLWIAQTEGAKYRGVQDIVIAYADGLQGFPEAIEAVYPQTAVQLCIVHLVRVTA
jgi:hypothetical protein